MSTLVEWCRENEIDGQAWDSLNVIIQGYITMGEIGARVDALTVAAAEVAKMPPNAGGRRNLVEKLRVMAQDAIRGR